LSKTLVLGLGNPLRGDDGVGPAVIAALQAHPLPPEVTLLDGGAPGLETALLFEGYRRAVIVDAAAMGEAPGTWRRFTPAEARLPLKEAGMRGTLHDAGLAEALALAEALGLLPPELVFYGVQPAEVGWAPGMSAPVATAVPAVCAAILHELT
jgi:hydrogenase maturation protease